MSPQAARLKTAAAAALTARVLKSRFVEAFTVKSLVTTNAELLKCGKTEEVRRDYTADRRSFSGDEAAWAEAGERIAALAAGTQQGAPWWRCIVMSSSTTAVCLPVVFATIGKYCLLIFYISS